MYANLSSNPLLSYHLVGLIPLLLYYVNIDTFSTINLDCEPPPLYFREAISHPAACWRREVSGMKVLFSWEIYNAYTLQGEGLFLRAVSDQTTSSNPS